MKANKRILLELKEEELEVLKMQYTKFIAKILATELQLEGVNQLLEKLYQNI